MPNAELAPRQFMTWFHSYVQSSALSAFPNHSFSPLSRSVCSYDMSTCAQGHTSLSSSQNSIYICLVYCIVFLSQLINLRIIASV